MRHLSLERRNTLVVWLLVLAVAATAAALGRFVFGAPWWLAIIIALVALLVNGWIAE